MSHKTSTSRINHHHVARTCRASTSMSRHRHLNSKEEGTFNLVKECDDPKEKEQRDYHNGFEHQMYFVTRKIWQWKRHIRTLVVGFNQLSKEELVLDKQLVYPIHMSAKQRSKWNLVNVFLFSEIQTEQTISRT